MITTQHFSFIFLIWNLFLAWIPYYFISNYYKTKQKLVQLCIILGTILFLPNAPYIVTDLFHLSKNLVAPMWFDLVVILSFSLLGMVFFIKTVSKLLQIFNVFSTSKLINISFKFLIMSSCAYGIYLGRYLRFNSWDIVTNSLELINQIITSIFNHNYYKETFAVTITFTVFLYFVFEICTSFTHKINTSKNELF